MLASDDRNSGRNGNIAPFFARSLQLRWKQFALLRTKLCRYRRKKAHREHHVLNKAERTLVLSPSRMNWQFDD
jgi:hypothetical protein